MERFEQFSKKKTKWEISRDKEQDRLFNLYPNVKLSSRYTDDLIPRYMVTNGTTFEEEYRKWKIYFTQNLLEKFEIFYNTYKPYEYISDRDIYYTNKVKEEFDKIINGELFVDVPFHTPDSPIRNYMKIYNFDENTIKKKSEIE